MKDHTDFVNYWEKEYQYKNSEDYDRLVDQEKNKDLPDNDSLQRLFVWKKGRPLPRKQQEGVDRKIEWLNRVCAEFRENKEQIIKHAEEEYLCRKEGGAIWNIFFLHCLAPEKWPIYDQHTYRAMKYMMNGEIPEEEKNDSEKYRNYKNEYVPFIKNNFEKCNQRTVDKALFAFGKFLKACPSDLRMNS